MRIVLIFLFLLNAIPLLAFEGKVVNSQGKAIAGASVLVLRPDSSIATYAKSDSLGIYHIEIPVYPAHLEIRSIGFKTAEFVLASEPDKRLQTILEENVKNLSEVIVTPEMMQRYDTHNSYHISQKDMERYSTFSQAMNVIPFLNVTADGAITYRGNSDIVVLLNGVQATSAEIKALAKDDVLKIDIYEDPPAQYALAGASTVINIITRQHLTGGNVAFDLNDSFYPIKAVNNISAFFNTGISRFSLLLNNEANHYKHVRADENLHYELNGLEYTKTKAGKNSPYDLDNNAVSLGFMTHKLDSWQLNANLTASIYKHDKVLLQTVTYSDKKEASDVRNDLYNRYNKQALNLYFFKTEKGNRQWLIDATGTLYNTRYASSYNETYQGNSTFSSESAYKFYRRSLLSTMQYTMPGLLGAWTFGTRNAYQYGKQIQSVSNLVQKENTLHLYAQLYGHKAKFYYQLIAATKYLHIWQDGRTIWSKWYPSPSATLWYIPSEILTIETGYTFTADVPSVALLSETEQWLDNHYVYKGNANLRPYKNHQVWLTGSLTTGHFNASLLGLIQYSPNAIINYFERKDKYILQSYGNQRFTYDAGGQLILDYFPLKNKSLKFHTVGIYLHYHGKGQDNTSWDGYRYQFMVSASYSINKWFFETYYQYPGQTMQGQLITPRAEAITIDVAFKPIPDMTIGLQWNQPFMNGFKEGERTTSGAIIQSNMMTNFSDFRNMICLKFIYNLSFGRHTKVPVQSVKNIDEDPGLLVK